MCYTFLKIKSKSLKDSKQTYEKPKLQSYKEQFRSWAVPKRRSIIGSHIRKSIPGSLQLYVLDVSAEALNACYPKNADCGRDKQACPDTKWWQQKTWFPVSKPVVMIPTWMNMWYLAPFTVRRSLKNSPSMKRCWYVVHSDCQSTTKHTFVCTATNYTQKMQVTYKKVSQWPQSWHPAKQHV